MADRDLMLHDVAFKYQTASEPLFANVTVQLPRGWTGVVGANGAGKTTFLHVALGTYAATEGVVSGPERVAYCPQRTDDPPPGLAALMASDDGDAYVIRGRLGIADDWMARWDSLSHGERKRAQIGSALWEGPDVFAVDEPTNHLDRDARAMVLEALRAFQGVGLLVSHDRELLDDLCRQCLFLSPPSVTLRPGGVTAGMAQAAREAETAVRERNVARRDLQRIEAEAAKRRELAEAQHRKRSKRGLGKNNAERFKRNLARMSGKDGTGGKLLRQMDGRVERARQRLDGARTEKTYDTGVWLPGSVSPKDVVYAAAATSIPMGDARVLHVPDLTVRRDDRIALTGPNGSGKSTLIRYLMETIDIPKERIVFLPQEVDIETSREMLDAVRSERRDALGHLMGVISRLGSRPGRLLDSETPSPGEIRKLMLARGISRSPYAIVMDEPTNHLDLPSITCLEEALAGCPCAMLLVSHDARFLGALARREWAIRTREDGDSVLTEGLMASSMDVT